MKEYKRVTKTMVKVATEYTQSPPTKEAQKVAENFDQSIQLKVTSWRTGRCYF